MINKIKTFTDLHQAGCFVMPNPWDLGSAKALEKMGFKALASTSAGLAWAKGRADGQITLEETLDHLADLASFSSLPINADFESGFAANPEEVYQNVTLATQTGIAGLSIEDSTGNPKQPLRSLDEAVERLIAAREAIDASATGVLLTARAENFFVGVPDLDDCLKRLAAYVEVGADCLYAPGIRSREQIHAVLEVCAPKPVNLLIGWPTDLTVKELAELGIRRISVGGALARTAWQGFLTAAEQLAQQGNFAGLAAGTPTKELNDLLKL